MRFIFSTIFILSSLLVICHGLLASMSSSNYQIWADVISEGGAEDANSANYQLKETAGEPAVGRASSTSYTTRGGFREMDYFLGNEVLTLSVSSNSIDLGTLSKIAAKTGAHTLTVDTNSTNGVSVTYAGATLTCSACSTSKTISAIGGTAAASAVGNSQFGLNAIYSSGTSPYASATTQYGAAGAYAFQTGDQIISSTGAINATVFNINYVANISGAESAGTYAATIVYTATANF